MSSARPRGTDQGCLGVFKCLCGLLPLSLSAGAEGGPESLAPTKDQFPSLPCVTGFLCESKRLLKWKYLSFRVFFFLLWVAKAMFVFLNSETVIDIDEVLLLLADHYTACICWVPLHIIMMWNLLVRVSVNSVIDFTVLTFYSITSESGPSLHVETCLFLNLPGHRVLTHIILEVNALTSWKFSACVIWCFPSEMPCRGYTDIDWNK